MASRPIPTTLNWVQARADCTLAKMFKMLALGIEEDISIMKLTLLPGDHVVFYMVPATNRFSVVREAMGNIPIPITDSVEFILSKDEITIQHNEHILQAHLTLNNEGVCKLKIGGNELEQWQVRRMALESLFFGPPKEPVRELSFERHCSGGSRTVQRVNRSSPHEDRSSAHRRASR